MSTALAKQESTQLQLELDACAQRIRDLVNVTRICIIEVGRELILAKDKQDHGDWLPWLKDNFGWHEATARRYMQVAEAFKSCTVHDMDGLTIEARALYLLSAPSVPAEVREKSKEREQPSWPR
jgi:hypothetical protein